MSDTIPETVTAEHALTYHKITPRSVIGDISDAKGLQELADKIANEWENWRTGNTYDEDEKIPVEGGVDAVIAGLVGLLVEATDR